MGRACLATPPLAVRQEVESKLAARDPDGWLTVQPGIERAIADLASYGCCVSFGEWKREVRGFNFSPGVPCGLGRCREVPGVHCARHERFQLSAFAQFCAVAQSGLTTAGLRFGNAPARRSTSDARRMPHSRLTGRALAYNILYQ